MRRSSCRKETADLIEARAAPRRDTEPSGCGTGRLNSAATLPPSGGNGKGGAEDNRTEQSREAPDFEELFPEMGESLEVVLETYMQPLTDTAIQIGEKIGPVTAELGNNSCQVPFAPDYIRRAQKRGAIGKKRKTAKC